MIAVKTRKTTGIVRHAQSSLLCACFIVLLASSIPFGAVAGTNKTGGTYELLQDTANARGGESAGGSYTVLSSVGQRTSNPAASGGTFNAVSGILGAVDTTPPDVAFTSPAASASASGTIAAVGSAFDRNDVEWTLYVGGGASPSAWSEVASGSGNMAPGVTFGNWNSADYAGDYTFRIAATDGHGNTAEGTVTFYVDYTFTISGTLPAFQWVFMGVPVNAAESDPLSVFGAENTFKIYRWNPAADLDPYLDRYESPDTLGAGDGFWIKAFYDDLVYSFEGKPVETNSACQLELVAGWNQISLPFVKPFAWGSVQVTHGGGTYDLATAASMNLIDPVLYVLDEENNTWLQKKDESEIMQPKGGCFVYAYQDVQLTLDPDNRILAKIVRPIEDYRIRISAAAPGSADPDNYIGAANEAAAEADPFDSHEPPRTITGIEGAYTNLYFPRSGWAQNAGRYTNDFRPLAPRAGHVESWTFNVDTSETGESVTLSWDAASLPAQRFSFTLVDTGNGETVDMAGTGEYSYIAAATGSESISTAHFRIDVEKLQLVETDMTLALAPGWSLVSLPMEPAVSDAREQLGAAAGRVQAMQFHAGRYYDTASQEGVDFQAGLACWLYAGEATELIFRGTPVGGAETIEIPLAPGFNAIGSPFAGGMTFGDNIIVAAGESELRLSEAAGAGIVDATLYEYDNGTGSYIPLGHGGVMEPWKGYFIRARSACTLKLKR